MSTAAALLYQTRIRAFDPTGMKSQPRAHLAKGIEPGGISTEDHPMKQSVVRKKYPIFVLELSQSESRFRTLEEIIAYLRDRIEESPTARFIGLFDHYAHTRGLAQGYLCPGIRGAKNIIFCFGITLPDPKALALRPRSIGVAETDRGFVISFMEPPMPVANAAVESWVLGLQRQEAP
jgi:hypothetical protein